MTTPTTALYVDPKGARGALKKYAGSDPASLSKDKSLFKVLGQAGGFAKYLHLVFARSVGAQKVVDALTAVKGVGKDVLDRCAHAGGWRRSLALFTDALCVFMFSYVKAESVHLIFARMFFMRNLDKLLSIVW